MHIVRKSPELQLCDNLHCRSQTGLCLKTVDTQNMGKSTTDDKIVLYSRNNQLKQFTYAGCAKIVFTLW